MSIIIILKRYLEKRGFKQVSETTDAIKFTKGKEIAIIDKRKMEIVRLTRRNDDKTD